MLLLSLQNSEESPKLPAMISPVTVLIIQIFFCPFNLSCYNLNYHLCLHLNCVLSGKEHAGVPTDPNTGCDWGLNTWAVEKTQGHMEAFL